MKRKSYSLPSGADINNAEDAAAIDLSQAIGRSEVDRRLLARAATQEHLKASWPLNQEVGYVNAFSLLIRTAATAALIGSRNPVDLAYALRVPEWAIRVALITLEASRWQNYFLPLLEGAMQFRSSEDEITNILDEFIESGLEGDVSLVDLLKAVGPCLPSVRAERV